MPACPGEALCSAGTCECQSGFLPPTCLQRAVAISGPLANARCSEDGEFFRFDVRLQDEPRAPVTIGVASTDPSETYVEPDGVVIDARTWQDPIAFSVTGVKDGKRDGDSAFQVVFALTKSSDARFDGIALEAIDGINFDARPVIADVDPAVVDVDGARVDVQVAEIDLDRVVVLFDDTIPLEFDVLEATRRRQSAGTIEDELATGAAVLSVLLPATDVEGDHTLTVFNPSSERNLTDVFNIFVTSNCPVEGSLGVDGECIDCPTGGICPGGPRVIATEGYWNPDPESGFVYECDPPERCSGTGECGDGYEAEFCGRCVDGYYTTAAGTCRQCVPSSVALFIVCDVLLWFGVSLTAWFASDEIFTKCVDTVGVLQMMGAVGSMVSANLSGFLVAMYDVLELFMGTYDLAAAECRTGVTWSERFGSTLLYASCIGAGLLVGVPARAAWLIKRARARGATEDVVATLRARAMNRASRIAHVWAIVVYFNLTRASLRSLRCFKPSEELGSFLVHSPADACYTVAHSAIMATAIAILLGLSLAYPAVYAFVHWRARRRGVDQDERFVARHGSHFAKFLPKFQLLYVVTFAKFFFLAVADASTDTTVQLGLGFSIFFVSFITIVSQRPYESAFDNWMNMALDLWNCLAITVNYLGDAADGKLASLISWVVVILMFLLFALAVGDLAYFTVVSRRKAKADARAKAAGLDVPSAAGQAGKTTALDMSDSENGSHKADFDSIFDATSDTGAGWNESSDDDNGLPPLGQAPAVDSSLERSVDPGDIDPSWSSQ